MATEPVARVRDPEVQELLVESVRLIAKAETLYHQLSEHQAEMAGFLRRAKDYMQPEDVRDVRER